MRETCLFLILGSSDAGLQSPDYYQGIGNSNDTSKGPYINDVT
jgi:hypothetical protein